MSISLVVTAMIALGAATLFSNPQGTNALNSSRGEVSTADIQNYCNNAFKELQVLHKNQRKMPTLTSHFPHMIEQHKRKMCDKGCPEVQCQPRSKKDHRENCESLARGINNLRSTQIESRLVEGYGILYSVYEITIGWLELERTVNKCDNLPKSGRTEL